MRMIPRAKERVSVWLGHSSNASRTITLCTMNQTLTSAIVSAGLVVLGSPLVEIIKGQFARTDAKRTTRKTSIHWWKVAIQDAETWYHDADPKLRKFRNDPNVLAMRE